MGQPSGLLEEEQDAAFWGVAPEKPTQSQGIWREHWPALQAYLAICTQWRMVADFNTGPRAIGLDYAAAEVGLKHAGIETTPDLWNEIQMIEIGARGAMNGTAQ